MKFLITVELLFSFTFFAMAQDAGPSGGGLRLDAEEVYRRVLKIVDFLLNASGWLLHNQPPRGPWKKISSILVTAVRPMGSAGFLLSEIIGSLCQRSQNDAKTISTQSQNKTEPIPKPCQNDPQTIPKRSQHDPKRSQKDINIL